MWTNWIDLAVCTRLCLALVHSLWQAAAVAALVAVLGLALRRRPAQWRYMLHVSGLAVALAALPVTLLVVDFRPRELPTTLAVAQVEPPTPDAVIQVPSSPDKHLEAPRPLAMEPASIDAMIEPTDVASHRMVGPVADNLAPAVPSEAVTPAPIDRAAAAAPDHVTYWRNAAVAGCAVYAVGVFVMLARLGRGIRAEQRLCRAAQRIGDGPAVRYVAQLARRWSMRVVPVVALARDIAVPKVVGLVRPMILLPATVLAGLSVSDLEMVLAHELAHVRRYDVWVSLLQRLTEVVLFFNPAVWYLSRRATVLREDCCDDLVCASLAASKPGASVRYAHSLLHVAELCCAGSRRDALAAALAGDGPLAAAALGRNPSELKRRIARILGEPLPRPLGLSRGGVAMLGALCVALVAGPVAWSAAEGDKPQPTAPTEIENLDIAVAIDDKPPAPSKSSASEPTANEPTTNTTNKPQQPGRDLYGDPLPAGAIARLGTVRFRPGICVDGIALVQDGSTVVCMERDDAAISIWDVRDGRLKRRLQANAYGLRAMDLSRDGKLVAAMGYRFDTQQHGTLTSLDIWELGTGKKLTETTLTDHDECAQAKFLPDGIGLLTIGRTGTLQIFDRNRGAVVLTQSAPGVGVNAAALSPDGTKAALATNMGVFIWDWTNAQPPQKVTADERTESVAYSPDGAILAVAARSDQVMRLISAVNGEHVKTLLVRGPRRYVKSVSYSPDGKLVATTSLSDYGVQIWDAASGERVRLLDMSPSSPGCAAFSADSKRLAASGTDGVISVWNVATGEEVPKFPEAHHGSIGQIVFANEESVFTSSDDGSIRAWDPATGQQRFACGHSKWARGLTVSHNGKLVASSGMDDTVRLWEAAKGQELLRLPGHGTYGGRRPVVFTADDKQLVSWGEDAYLRRWDIKTGKVVAEHALRPAGVTVADHLNDPDESPSARARLDNWQMNLFAAVLSPDAQSLVLAIGPSLHVFDANSGKEVRTIVVDEGTPNHLAISPDSKRLLATTSGSPAQIKLPGGGVRHSTSDFQVVRVWNLETGEPLLKLNVQGSYYGPATFSPDGRYFATATRTLREGGQPRTSVIRVWDAVNNAEVKTIEGIPSVVQALAFSPANKRIGAGMADTTALVWNLDVAQGKK